MHDPDPATLERRGRGPPLLLVHGSAVDRSTWSIQLALLSDRFTLGCYDRDSDTRSVFPQAQQAAHAARALGGKVVAVGSSFGGVIVLELARRRPELLRGAVLCEPPLPSHDDVSAVPQSLGCRMHHLAAERGGEAAAELFLRTVITDGAYERMPARIRRRALATWPQIRDDATALARYRVRYAQLRDVRVPFLLLGGERSPPMYAHTLEALAAALPRAELRTLRGAGHMMHADAYRRFGAAVAAFCDDIGHAGARDP